MPKAVRSCAHLVHPTSISLSVPTTTPTEHFFRKSHHTSRSAHHRSNHSQAWKIKIRLQHRSWPRFRGTSVFWRSWRRERKAWELVREHGSLIALVGKGTRDTILTCWTFYRGLLVWLRQPRRPLDVRLEWHDPRTSPR